MAKLTKRISERRFERLGTQIWLGQAGTIPGVGLRRRVLRSVTRKLTVNGTSWNFAWQRRSQKGGTLPSRALPAFGLKLKTPSFRQDQYDVDGDWNTGLARFGPDVRGWPISVKAGVGPTTWWADGVWPFREEPRTRGGFEFARFATGPVGQRSTLGYFPANLKSMLERKDLFADSFHEIFLNMLPFARSRPALPVELCCGMSLPLPGTM